MSKPHCLVFFVIGVLLMLQLEVNAQPTVDDGGSSREFHTFDEAARDEKLANIARDVKEVKNLLGSCQESCSAVDSSSLCKCILHLPFCAISRSPH